MKFLPFEELTSDLIDLMCEIAYEATIAYLRVTDQLSRESSWADAPAIDRATTVSMVVALLKFHDATPRDIQRDYRSVMEANGWRYGDCLNGVGKTSPMLSKWQGLSAERAAAFHVFWGSVRSQQALMTAKEIGVAA